MAMDLVSFYYGNQVDFESLGEKIIEGALYFITDTGRIYLGGASGDSTDVTNDVILLTNSIPTQGIVKKLYISNTWPNSNGLFDARVWDSNSNSYVSIIHHLTDAEILSQYLGATNTVTITNPNTGSGTVTSHVEAFTKIEREKLLNIESGAEVNVQSDWTVTNTAADSYIKNKPVISSDKSSIVASSATLPNGNAVYNYLLSYITNDTAGAAKIKSLYESNANTNAFTDNEKSKLAGIESGAEVNVQADWTETVNSSDAYIKNKPVIDTTTFTNSNNYIPSSKLMSNKLSGYLNRDSGVLTGPLFLNGQRVYFTSDTSGPYMVYNSVTGGIDIHTL